MSRWINFKDSNSDQHAYKVEHMNAVFITAPTTIKIYVRNAINPSGRGTVPLPLTGSVSSGFSDDIITLTVTAGKAERILKRKILRPISRMRSNRPLYISSEISGITTVAWTQGTVV